MGILLKVESNNIYYNIYSSIAIIYFLSFWFYYGIFKNLSLNQTFRFFNMKSKIFTKKLLFVIISLFSFVNFLDVLDRETHEQKFFEILKNNNMKIEIDENKYGEFCFMFELVYHHNHKFATEGIYLFFFIYLLVYYNFEKNWNTSFPLSSQIFS